MSRVEVSASKGLTVHKSGQGFIDTNLQEITITSGVNNAAAATYTLATVSEKAALMHLIVSNNTADGTGNNGGDAAQNVVVLPASATKGQIKVIILQASVAINGGLTAAQRQGKLLVKSGNSTIATLQSVSGTANDFAICIFDGTNWLSGFSTL